MDDVVKNFMTALSNTQYIGNDALYQAIRVVQGSATFKTRLTILSMIAETPAVCQIF